MRIYTVGHSNVPAERIIKLLKDHDLEILVDVRSQPYSRHSPQFNREAFQRALARESIEYAFAGEWLGGRPKDPSCYEDDQVSYMKIEMKDWYKRGVVRLLEITGEKRTAIMCSEEDPRRCHRHNLVTKTLMEEGVEVVHIRGDGRLEDAREVAMPLRRQAVQLDFLSTQSETTHRATIYLYTIGFTQKTAKEFFTLLREHQIDCVIDVRLNNTSQLAGFSKRDDLAFFLGLFNIEYEHWVFLAPSEEIRRVYSKQGRDWLLYERSFMRLIEERNILDRLDREFFARKHCCFLCSEAEPERCHRRLLAQYLSKHWEDVEIVHL